MIEPGTFRCARWLTAPLVNTAVGGPGTGAAYQGPNVNTQSYRSLFHEHNDVHCPGLVLSEAKSGQFGSLLANEGKPPASSRRPIDRVSPLSAATLGLPSYHTMHPSCAPRERSPGRLPLSRQPHHMRCAMTCGQSSL